MSEGAFSSGSEVMSSVRLNQFQDEVGKLKLKGRRRPEAQRRQLETSASESSA